MKSLDRGDGFSRKKARIKRGLIRPGVLGKREMLRNQQDSLPGANWLGPSIL